MRVWCPACPKMDGGVVPQFNSASTGRRACIVGQPLTKSLWKNQRVCVLFLKKRWFCPAPFSSFCSIPPPARLPPVFGQSCPINDGMCINSFPKTLGSFEMTPQVCKRGGWEVGVEVGIGGNKPVGGDWVCTQTYKCVPPPPHTPLHSCLSSPPLPSRLCVPSMPSVCRVAF